MSLKEAIPKHEAGKNGGNKGNKLVKPVPNLQVGSLANLVSDEKGYQQLPGTTYAEQLKLREEDRREREIP